MAKWFVRWKKEMILQNQSNRMILSIVVIGYAS